MKLSLNKLVRILALVTLSMLHLVGMLFLRDLNAVKIFNLQSIWLIVLIFTALIVLPVVFSSYIYNTFRSRLEFNIISYITTFIIFLAFTQINNRVNISTGIPILEKYGLSINWGVQLGLVMLMIVNLGIYFDLLFARFTTQFRLSFTSTFAMQLILSLGMLSYIHLLNIGNLTERIYRNPWLETAINLPIWFIVFIFAFISSLITLFYFGRGNVLQQVRPMWVKIGWRFLVFLINLEFIAIILLLPQNYWWKVLFYILIWDFITVPISRIYKQKTDLFFDRLKISLAYHLILFIIVFWVSHRI